MIAGLISSYFGMLRGQDTYFQVNNPSDLDEPFENVIEAYVRRYKGSATFRFVADETIVPEYGFGPNDSIERIRQASPEFRDHVDIAAIRDEIGNQDALREIFLASLSSAQAEVAQGISAVAEELAVSATAARERWALEEDRRRTLEDERTDAINDANARATAGLAATFIGFTNRDLGRQTQALSDAVFGVRAGLRAYKTAQRANAHMGLASTALTGNFVGAAIGLVNAFIDSGPTADQVILEQIQNLHEHIGRVRLEMHERFDAVDARLDEMLGLLTGGIEVLETRLQEIKNGLEFANYRLGDLARGQRHIRDLIVTQTEVLEANLTDQHRALAGCDDDSFPVVDTLTGQSDFQRCVAFFGAVARGLSRLQLRDSRADPDRIVNWHAGEFRILRERLQDRGDGRSGAMPVGVLVGPEAWSYVAHRYREYLARRSNLARANQEYLDNSSVVVLLREGRENLTSYVETIRDELMAFQEASGPTTFSLVFEEAMARIEELRPIVSGALDEYYRDSARSGLRMVEREDGIVPEIRLEDGEAPWQPLSEFYTQDERPQWANMVADCDLRVEGAREPDPGRYLETVRDLVDSRFAGRTIGDWLHPAEMAPARLGMGRIDICESLQGEFSGTSWRGRVSLAFAFDYCEGEARIVRSPEFAKGAFIFVVDRVSLANFFRGFGGYPVSVSVRDWAGELRRHIDSMVHYGVAADKVPRLTAACRQRYRRGLEEKRQELSIYVGERLAEEEAFDRAGDELLRLGRLVQLWVWTAFDKAVGRSEAAAAIVSGEIGMPRLMRMLQIEGRKFGYSWEILEEAERRIEELAGALRSSAMREVVEYGFGHRLVTETVWGELGDGRGSR